MDKEFTQIKSYRFCGKSLRGVQKTDTVVITVNMTVKCNNNFIFLLFIPTVFKRDILKKIVLSTLI